MHARRLAPLAVSVALAAWGACGSAVPARAGLPGPPVEQWRINGPETDWDLPILDTIPIVVQLTDDDGDGDIDVDDSPDVVLLAIRNGGGSDGRLYALDGETGSEHWRVSGTFGRPPGLGSTAANVAAGDIDGDGLVEIVVLTADGFLVFENDGTPGPLIAAPIEPGAFGHSVSLADVDQDGVVDLIDQAVVVSSDGSWQWKGTAGGYGGPHNGWSLPMDVRTDIPGLEIFAGNTLYDQSGDIIWQAATEEGPASIGDLDGDGRPEIVLSAGRKLYILSDLGDVLAPPIELGGDPIHVTGIPLLLELDGDTTPELLLPANTFLVALEWDGLAWTELWREDLNDEGGAASATAYDLDGDGIDEIVHRDLTHWYIREGRCGSILHAEPHPSQTGVALPVIANLDRDPAAEVLVGGVNWVDYDNMYVAVYELPDTCTPRSIWNEAGYHTANVEDDGSIPRIEAVAWASGDHAYSQAPESDSGTATGLAPLSAVPGGSCANSVMLEWQPAVMPDGSSPAYDIWRVSADAATDCCAPAAGTLIAEGVSETSVTDDGAALGSTLRYIVRARTADGASCASISTCSDVIALDDPALLPAPPGPALRVAHAAGVVTLDWSDARPLEPDEHFHLLGAAGSPTGPFARRNPEGSVATSYADLGAVSPLIFYDLRVSDSCDNESSR